MTTQTEALKLALENYMAAFGQALEAYGIELQQQQIEADRFAHEALAQPAVAEQHKQEPTKLWCETCEGSGEVYQEHQVGCHVGGHFKCPGCDGDGYILSRFYSTTPYVATPRPQRTWVGLTDEDKKEYAAQDFGGNRLDAMDWAEKRLKEKNI